MYLYFIAQADPTNEILPKQGWADFGLAGLVIAALMAFLVFLVKGHKDERAEWKADIRDMHDETNIALNKFTESANGLTLAIKEMIFRNEAK